MIRAALPADAPAIAAIWNHYICDTLVTFTTSAKSPREVEHLIRARALDPHQSLLVAVTPDPTAAGGTETLLGFAGFGPFRAGPGYAATAELTILLDPEQGGQGVGRALMDTLLSTAEHAGLHALVAAISSANPGAVAFHQKMGFSQVGRLPQVGRKGGMWLDLILLQKVLENPA